MFTQLIDVHTSCTDVYKSILQRIALSIAKCVAYGVCSSSVRPSSARVPRG